MSHQLLIKDKTGHHSLVTCGELSCLADTSHDNPGRADRASQDIGFLARICRMRVRIFKCGAASYHYGADSACASYHYGAKTGSARLRPLWG